MKTIKEAYIIINPAQILTSIFAKVSDKPTIENPYVIVSDYMGTLFHRRPNHLAPNAMLMNELLSDLIKHTKDTPVLRVVFRTSSNANGIECLTADTIREYSPQNQKWLFKKSRYGPNDDADLQALNPQVAFDDKDLDRLDLKSLGIPLVIDPNSDDMEDKLFAWNGTLDTQKKQAIDEWLNLDRS